MNLQTTEYKRCDVVKAVGRIDSNTAPELEKAFNNVLKGGKSGIVFDLFPVAVFGCCLRLKKPVRPRTVNLCWLMFLMICRTLSI